MLRSCLYRGLPIGGMHTFVGRKRHATFGHFCGVRRCAHDCKNPAVDFYHAAVLAGPHLAPVAPSHLTTPRLDSTYARPLFSPRSPV